MSMCRRLKMRDPGAKWLILLATVGLTAGCSQLNKSGDVTICVSSTNCGAAIDSSVAKQKPPPVAPTPTTKPTPVPPIDPKEAMLMLRENCSGCHGLGRDKRSFWPMPPEFEIPLRDEVIANGGDPSKVETFESLIANPQKIEQVLTKMEADQFSVEVFKSIENKLLGLENAIPKAMRPAMSANTRARFIGLLDQLTAAGASAGKTGLVSTPTALSLNEARSWCTGCHSPGGSGADVWNKANGSFEDWRSFAEKAKASVADNRMPPAKLSDAERTKWLGLAAWFQQRMPLIVSEARSKYHGQNLELGLPVDFSYKCNSVVTGRQFLNRLTADALGRPPTVTELGGVPNLDSAITAEMRNQLVDRLSTVWKDEFLNYGFRTFAHKISGAQKIKSSLVISDPVLRDDIADEFFQLVKAESLANKSYKEILLSKKVFVTKKTAPFYNATCEQEANKLTTEKYVACQMDANNSPRDNFFTTLGFLASKSSSMFLENNNYGRVAALNEVIRGESLLANTDGEEGETVDPLPNCFQTSDWRVLASSTGFAPRGTASIPASGNFCQGCHVRRNLAAGAIAFRPFGPIGETLDRDVECGTKVRSSLPRDLCIAHVNTSEARNQQEALLKSYITQALTDEWRMKPPGVTEPERLNINQFYNFLNIGQSPGQERGCIVDPLLLQPKIVTKVSDLVDYELRDELALARGLARIIPRSLSNLNATNPEIINAVISAWNASGGQLLPIFQSYFRTDTYACVSSGGN